MTSKKTVSFCIVFLLLFNCKAFDWIHLIEKAKKQGIKINYYLVNCDLQEQWNLTDEQIKQVQGSIQG